MALTVDEISELYRRIASVTTKYTFTAPVDHTDCAVVHGELHTALGAGWSIEVYHRLQIDVVITVWSIDGQRVYQREMLISAAPAGG